MRWASPSSRCAGDHRSSLPKSRICRRRAGAAPTWMSPRASSKRHACSNSLSSWPGRPSDNSLCSTWVTKSRPFCSPTIAMAPPPNCSPVTPSACSSRTHCPMPCASSTWTRYLRPSASRSISIWPCWSSPVACIVSSPSPCAATPMPRPVTSFVISSTHRLTSLFPNAKFTCVSTGVAGAAAQAAEGPALTILLSDADGIHGEVAETLRRDLEKSGTEPAEIVVATVPAPLARVPGRLLLTVGTQALQSALGQDLRAPILAVLLPRQAFERLADHAGRRAAHSVSALFLDQPVVRQLDLIRLALPAYFGRR